MEPPGLEKESSAEDTGASCQGRRDRCRCNESRGKPLHCRSKPSHSKLNNGKEELLSSLPTLLKTFDAACDWWHLLKEKCQSRESTEDRRQAETEYHEDDTIMELLATFEARRAAYRTASLATPSENKNAYLFEPTLFPEGLEPDDALHYLTQTFRGYLFSPKTPK